MPPSLHIARMKFGKHSIPFPFLGPFCPDSHACPPHCPSAIPVRWKEGVGEQDSVTCLVAGWERGCFFTMSLGTHIKGQVSLESAHADEDDLSAVFSIASASPSSSTVKRQTGEELTWGFGCTLCSYVIILLLILSNRLDPCTWVA